MRSRPAVALAVAVSLTLSGAANASTKHKPKPKPVPPPCHTLTDPTRDTPEIKPGGSLYDPNLDVTSADIANNGAIVTGVMRLAKLQPSDSMAPTGRLYMFLWSFATDSKQNRMELMITPTGIAATPTGATYVIDYAKAEIHITAQIDALPGHPIFAKGDTLTLVVQTGLTIPATTSTTNSFGDLVANPSTGDSGQATKPYVLYSPSCVKLGA